jgi:hypothetical protein
MMQPVHALVFITKQSHGRAHLVYDIRALSLSSKCWLANLHML